MSIQEIADCMKGGVQPSATSKILEQFKNSCIGAAKDLKIDLFLDEGLNVYQVGVVVRGAVMQRIADVTLMSKIALSRGFLLPDNPFVEIDRFNPSRRVFDKLNLSEAKAKAMADAAVKLSEVTKLYLDGEITFARKPAFQLSSYEVSVDGMSPQSGDALVDILGYQPDGDFIKRKRALDSLAKLDFSKRRPYLLFTADFEGAALVCWSRMHDASGYKISRRNVFATVDLPDVYLDNEKVLAFTKELMADDRFYQALTFYDWLNHQDVLVYLDKSTTPDTLYSFTVSGIQNRAPGTPFIFDVPTSNLFFSPALADQLNEIIRTEAVDFKRDPSLVSPYPALAEVVYGDPSYGWVLAGVNTVAAIRRGEGADSVRALTFLGSTVDGILAAGRAGKLVIPQDVGSISINVDNSLSAYGVSQTIIATLDGLGMTEFIAGKDDPAGTPTQQGIERSTSGLSRILSVIDPETATLDTKVLVSSLANPSHRITGKSQFVKPVLKSTKGIPIDNAIQAETLDLTTYVGIGKLMAILRTVYDFFPGAVS